MNPFLRGDLSLLAVQLSSVLARTTEFWNIVSLFPVLLMYFNIVVNLLGAYASLMSYIALNLEPFYSTFCLIHNDSDSFLVLLFISSSQSKPAAVWY